MPQEQNWPHVGLTFLCLPPFTSGPCSIPYPASLGVPKLPFLSLWPWEIPKGSAAFWPLPLSCNLLPALYLNSQLLVQYQQANVLREKIATNVLLRLQGFLLSEIWNLKFLLLQWFSAFKRILLVFHQAFSFSVGMFAVCKLFHY